MFRRRHAQAVARNSPQQPNLSGGRNREGVGNLISGDKTLMESPERGKAPTKGNNKNRKKRVA